MKILIIASWYPTVDQPLNGIFFQQRARALARMGCQVSVAAPDVRLRLHGKKSGISVCHREGITEYRYLKRNMTPFWEEGIAKQQIAMIRKIYRQVCKDSGKPDVIHLESARCAYAAVALANAENIPLTYTEHYSGILNSLPGSFLDRSMGLAVDAADRIFLISSAMKRRLAPPEEKCTFLPNAIDFNVFSIAAPESPFVFGALGGLNKLKGYDILLRAFAKVREVYPNCRLEIGGDGPEKEALLTLRKELGLEDCVHFPGRIPAQQRSVFYHGKSAFVCSSLTETFSIVTVEAFASGLPVVATKCGGPEDLVNDTNGYLVEKGDADALAAGMLQMLRCRFDFDSEQIRQDAYERYHEASVVNRQLARFEDIVFPREVR